MAKLEGVKVIDMVNGEITKIAYNGAEYKAEELSYAAQQEGDIVLNTTETNDATIGGYYEVGSDGDVRDDVGVTHTNIQFRGRTFRKVSPKLEIGGRAKLRGKGACLNGFHAGETVTILANEGRRFRYKVENLDSDLIGYTDADNLIPVASPKEEDDRQAFKNGDKVRLLSGGDAFPLHGFYDGSEYEVSNVDSHHSNGTRIEIKAGSMLNKGFALPSELELITENTLKEGEYAKVIGKTIFSDISIGSLVKITDDIDEDGDIEITLLDESEYDYAKPESLEKVSEEEAKRLAKKKLPVGSFAKVVQDGHPQEGNIVKITENDRITTSVYIYKTEKIDRSEGDIYEIDDLIAATDEEVKFAKIGRKPGEFKNGDIAEVTNENGANRVKVGDLIIVDKMYNDRPYEVIDAKHGYILVVKLIAPASARVDIA